MSSLALAASVSGLALLSLAAARIFASRGRGLLTGGLFALTPVLWRQFQDAPGALVPLVCVAGWLAAMAQVERRPASVWLAAAGASLGLGAYTSNAAIVMMPVFLALTLAVLYLSAGAPRRDLAIVAGTFALVAGALAFSFLVHPERFRDIVNAYELYDADRFNLRQGIREMTSWVGLTARSAVYYDFFNPVFLFLTGEVLLWPLIVLVPVGLHRALAVETTLMARLVAAGFLAAPFAASLTAEAPTPSRTLFMTPFAALLAAYGVRGVAGVWRRWSRA